MINPEKNVLEAKVRELLMRKEEILFAYIFGSLVEETVFRDIDVAVYLKKEHEAGDGFWYSLRLGIELEKATGRRVDLVLLNTAPDHIIHSVSRGIIIVDKDADWRTDFISAAWKRYFDIQAKRWSAAQELTT